MKLVTKYMARCSVKKLQLTFLDVNQINFKIYDRTWKSSLSRNGSPLELQVVLNVVGSHTAKKKKAALYISVGDSWFSYSSLLPCANLGNSKQCQRPKLLAYVCIWKLVYSLWRRFWSLLFCSFSSHAESRLHLWPCLGLCIYADVSQQRVLI